ncbi:MAG: NAD kinase [Phycisphaerae bacterium]|nr:NAD kinase [Phycisphaerae bacterium]|tara:strand:+ start:1020 stop:1916 length:897 start_codon:yes stop_codon:yes gene_type:complete
MSEMPDTSLSTTTAIILADPDREEAQQACSQIERILLDLKVSFTKQSPEDSALAWTGAKPDVAIVIGGDGTMISQTRRLVDHGIPMIGINCGRLGFLAPFSPETFEIHASSVLSENRKLEHRMMLQIQVQRSDGSETITRRAMNDGIITAGSPFRMIQMSTAMDGQQGPPLSGDGLVVATPTGSTGHSASTGGPIVDPRVEAIIVTPIAAQSLAFRPFALEGGSTLEVMLTQVNEGTSLVLDGQKRVQLHEHDRVRFARYSQPMGFVNCPGHPFWRILHDKLGWAAPPRGRDDTMSTP